MASASMQVRRKADTWMGLIIRTGMICLTIAAVGAVGMYLFFQRLDEVTSPAGEAAAAGPVAPAAPAARPARMGQMLVHVCTDGLTLQPQFVRVSSSAARSEVLTELVEEAVQSSSIGLSAGQAGGSALPFTVRAVYELDGLVIVDLARESAAGSLDFRGECLLAYSIVNSVADNFDEIQGVQILVDGVPSATLAGALDLTEPLVPNAALRSGG